MRERVSVGAFALGECIGSGGMGTIWSAVHVPTGEPAALKCVRPELLSGPTSIERFRREVRVVAGLRHPSIVEVYDYGVIDAAAEVATGGLLRAGGPFLAMELSRLGDANALLGRLTWRALRGLLLQVLDALAHAHAHRVIHLDVKPGNLLRCGDGLSCKLTDFGIARVVRGGVSGEEGLVGGTPDFMAPEQLRGDWRDLGPWTDLYAVGGLAYALAGVPRPSLSDPNLQQRHMGDWRTAPPIPADMGFPPEFQVWLDGLLRADPAQRVDSAAVAARMLEEMPEQPPAPPRATARAAHTAPSTSSPPRALETWYDELPSGAAPPSGASTRTLDGEVEWPGPEPQSWRERRAATSLSSMKGVGLGLYGLRAVPLVDREAEREQLWRRLHEVHEGGEPAVVRLRGASGFGKTRLAEWLCVRAEELGIADALRVTHSPISTQGDGLQGTLDRLLRTTGLSAEAARGRLRRWLSDRGRFRGSAVLEGLFSDASGGVGLRERSWNAALLHLLAIAGQRRVQLLFLDDVQWGLSSLGFVEQLLADGAARILVVMTSQDEALAERPEEREVLQRILARAGSLSLEVGPLPEAERPALVRGLLGLEGALAEQLEQRTAGNAMFAVQLVEDWVSRELLIPGEEGFRLHDGAELSMPDDLHGVWRQRLERLIVGWPPADEAALELAAALGQDVSEPEWAAVCALAGTPPSPELLGGLLDAGLARYAEGEARWSFAHGMLREVLLRRAARAGRLAARHLSCARYLARTPGLTARSRRVGHLLAAGADEEAAALLFEHIEELFNYGHGGLMSQGVQQLEGALARVRAPEDDRRWVGAMRFQVRLLMTQGRVPEASEICERAIEAASRGGHDALRLRLRSLQGRLALQLGDFEQARARWQVVVEASATPSHHRLLETGLHGLAHVAAFQGKLAEAIDYCERGITLREARGEIALGLRLLLARTQMESGQLDASLAGVRYVAEQTDPLLQPQLVNRLDTLMGDILRQQGEPAEAEACFRRVMERSEILEPWQIPTQQINIGGALQDQGRYAEGREILSAAVSQLRADNRKHLEALTCVLLLSSAAHAGDWQDWEDHADRAEALLAETRVSLAELALAWESSMRLCEAAGQSQRAARSRGAAVDVWTALGRTADAARLG